MRRHAQMCPWLAVLGLVTLGMNPPSLPAAVPALGGASSALLRQTAPDSEEVVGSARQAQRRFERVRRQYSPLTWRGSGGRCDERVGRFCYWHDDDEDWHPPPEHERIAAEREHLIAQLASAAQTARGDGWVAGQRVRYLLEAGHTDEALAAATRDCAADAWWCSTLAGLVRHETMAFEYAEAEFDRALALMPDEQRCTWTDIELLLDPGLRSAYRRLDCADRGPTEDRFWWLADPLLMVPGNERRTEHFARLTLNELFRSSSTPRQGAWRDDNRELLIRYGPVIGWERERPPVASVASSGSLIGHHRHGGRHFAPPAALQQNPGAIAPGAWDLDPDRPHTSYAARYATSFEALDHQLAVFRRGDVALVVAQTSFPPGDEKLVAGDSGAVVALGWTARPRQRPAVARSSPPGPVTAGIPWTSGVLVSVEGLAPEDSLAARDRFWLDLAAHDTPGLALSDVLLLREPDEPIRTLDDALPLALRSFDVDAGQDLGLYWEVYGVDSAATLDVSLEVERVGKSFLRRAAEWAGIVGVREARISVRWRDPVPSAAIIPRAMVIRLNDDMQGTYVLTLRVQRDDGTAEARSARQLFVHR